MKRLAIAATVFIALAVLDALFWYGIGAFVSLEPDITEWTREGRAWVVFLSLVTAPFAVLGALLALEFVGTQEKNP